MATRDHSTPVPVHLSVVCHAGFKGDERPIRFRLGGTDYFIEEILEQWYGTDVAYFKVRVEDGGVCTLRRSLALPEGGWVLEGYRPGCR